MTKSLRKATGFTLVEVIVVLSILAIVATVAVPIFTNLLTESRVQVTRSNMEEIQRAILGDPSVDFVGYRQMMQANPDPLSDLWTAAGSALNPFLGLGEANYTFIEADAGLDGWGNPIDWTDSALTDIFSWGADETNDSGGNDDIVLTIP